MSLATLDPGSFWGGVAVGVIGTVAGGVILAIILGIPRLLLGRRAERREEQAAQDIRRTPIRVGAHIVAGELREAAEIAERCEGGHHVPEATAKLRLAAWEDRRGEMLGLRDENPDLWETLTTTHEALTRSKRDGAWPPRSEDLIDLASRLERAAE